MRHPSIYNCSLVPKRADLNTRMDQEVLDSADPGGSPLHSELMVVEVIEKTWHFLLEVTVAPRVGSSLGCGQSQTWSQSLKLDNG